MVGKITSRSASYHPQCHFIYSISLTMSFIYSDVGDLMSNDQTYLNKTYIYICYAYIYKKCITPLNEGLKCQAG